MWRWSRATSLALECPTSLFARNLHRFWPASTSESLDRCIEAPPVPQHVHRLRAPEDLCAAKAVKGNYELDLGSSCPNATRGPLKRAWGRGQPTPYSLYV